MDIFGANDDKTATENLYWQWKLETGSTPAEIYNNDLLDSEWMGDSIVLGVQAMGSQVMDGSQAQYTVTYDLNGGTLANHGDSAQITKDVTYGEAYGELPTPTREGYTFMGWNGKNKFSGLTKGIGIDLTNGGEMSNCYTRASTDYIPIGNNSNNNYYLSGLTDTLYDCIFAYNENKEYMGRSPAGAYSSRTINISDLIRADETGVSGTISYIKISTYENINTSGNIDEIDELNIQLEEGSVATPYEPYYLSPTTKVTQTKNHTLTAIWKKN